LYSNARQNKKAKATATYTPGSANVVSVTPVVVSVETAPGVELGVRRVPKAMPSVGPPGHTHRTVSPTPTVTLAPDESSPQCTMDARLTPTTPVTSGSSRWPDVAAPLLSNAVPDGHAKHTRSEEGVAAATCGPSAHDGDTTRQTRSEVGVGRAASNSVRAAHAGRTVRH
jgi:hypothetical protein